MAIVGCTSVTDGTPAVDTAMAPAYRESVSASVSASVATSSIQESRHQQSLTTQAVVRACESFAASSKDAVDKVNDFVVAYNQGRDTTPSEGPAIDTLNHSAELVEGNSGGPLSTDLHHALNAYADAARDLAPPSAATGIWRRLISASISSTTPRPKPSSSAERPYESLDVQRYVLCDDKCHRAPR